MQKSCNINQHFNKVSHFKLSTATFAWFNTEVMQKLNLLYVAKLLRDLIHNFVNPWISQGFPESYAEIIWNFVLT